MKYLLIFIFLFAFPVLASEVIPTKKELPKNDVCRYDSIIIKEAFEYSSKRLKDDEICSRLNKEYYLSDEACKMSLQVSNYLRAKFGNIDSSKVFQEAFDYCLQRPDAKDSKNLKDMKEFASRKELLGIFKNVSLDNDFSSAFNVIPDPLLLYNQYFVITDKFVFIILSNNYFDVDKMSDLDSILEKKNQNFIVYRYDYKYADGNISLNNRVALTQTILKYSNGVIFDVVLSDSFLWRVTAIRKDEKYSRLINVKNRDLIITLLSSGNPVYTKHLRFIDNIGLLWSFDP